MNINRKSTHKKSFNFWCKQYFSYQCRPSIVIIKIKHFSSRCAICSYKSEACTLHGNRIHLTLSQHLSVISRVFSSLLLIIRCLSVSCIYPLEPPSCHSMRFFFRIHPTHFSIFLLQSDRVT